LILLATKLMLLATKQTDAAGNQSCTTTFLKKQMDLPAFSPGGPPALGVVKPEPPVQLRGTVPAVPQPGEAYH